MFFFCFLLYLRKYQFFKFKILHIFYLTQNVLKTAEINSETTCAELTVIILLVFALADSSSIKINF